MTCRWTCCHKLTAYNKCSEKREMTSEELIEQLAERPFRPVRIHLSNGRTHEVRHPEMAIVGEDVIALGVESDNGGLPRIRVIVYRP